MAEQKMDPNDKILLMLFGILKLHPYKFLILIGTIITATFMGGWKTNKLIQLNQKGVTEGGLEIINNKLQSQVSTLTIQNNSFKSQIEELKNTTGKNPFLTGGAKVAFLAINTKRPFCMYDNSDGCVSNTVCANKNDLEMFEKGFAIPDSKLTQLTSKTIFTAFQSGECGVAVYSSTDLVTYQKALSKFTMDNAYIVSLIK